MITKYPNNLAKQIGNVLRFNYRPIIIFFLLATIAYIVIDVLEVQEAKLPVVPVTILGGGLAIFLGFRNNAAYDRWWEARKIWGAMVNSSRSFGTKVLTFISTDDPSKKEDVKALHKRLIHRHIAYINALRHQLRNKDKWDDLKSLMSEDEFNRMLKSPNKATFLTHEQGKDIRYALDQGYVEEFRHISLMKEIGDFYDHQGKSERIKKTVFPFYYTYFTEVFLWLFIILLPFSLVHTIHMSFTVSLSTSVAISFVFFILDKSGKITEDPFENRASDTPLTAICNTIERDLRHMLNEDLPDVYPPRYTRYDVEFVN